MEPSSTAAAWLQQFGRSAEVVLDPVVTSCRALQDGVAELAVEVDQRPLALGLDLREERLHQIGLVRQFVDRPAELLRSGRTADRVPGGRADGRLDHDLLAVQPTDDLAQAGARGDLRRHDRDALLTELEQVLLVGVPADQVGVVEHRYAGLVELAEPFGELQEPDVVVPDRAEQHRVVRGPVDRRVGPDFGDRVEARSTEGGRERQVVRVQLRVLGGGCQCDSRTHADQCWRASTGSSNRLPGSGR